MTFWILLIFLGLAYVVGLLLDSVLTQSWAGQPIADFASAFTSLPTWEWGLYGIIPYIYPKEPVDAFVGILTWNFAFFDGNIGQIFRAIFVLISGYALIWWIMKALGRA